MQSDKTMKAVLVDLGHVIIGSDVMKTCVALARYGNHSPEEILEYIFVQSGLKQQFGVNALTAEEFHRAVHDGLHLRCTFQEFVTAWNSLLLAEHQAVIAVLHQLKEHGYVLVLVSDTNILHVTALSTYGFWQLFPQEHRVLSYEVGISKALDTVDVLRMAAHKAGCAPENGGEHRHERHSLLQYC